MLGRGSEITGFALPWNDESQVSAIPLKFELIMSARKRHIALPSQSRAFIAVLLMLSLVGCAVGPDFKPPAPPQVSRYTAQPSPAHTGAVSVAGGSVQHFVDAGDIPGDWWTLFHSRALNGLIAQALAHNPDLKAAQAALLAAQGNHARRTRRVLPVGKCRRIRQSRTGSARRARSGAKQQRVPVQPVHAAGQRFVRAGRVRPEPAQRRIAQGARTSRAFPDDRRG